MPQDPTGRLPDAVNRRLSTDRYVSHDFARLEYERLWPRVWQVAGLAADVATPGDYLTYQIGPTSVLIVRQPDGLRAFHNVCRHRGATLCESVTGHAESFRCPYHQWEWAIDGRLRKIPCRNRFPQIGADADVALQDVAVREWAGLVWVHFAADPEPLEDYLDGLAPLIDAYRLDDYALIEDQTTEIECNWKVALDANSEFYHVHSVHPQLLWLYDDGNARTEIRGRHTTIAAPFGGPSSTLPAAERTKMHEMLEFFLQDAGIAPKSFAGAGTDVRRTVQQHLRQSRDYDFGTLPDEQLTDYRTFLVFPNLSFNFFGLRLVVIRHRPHPTDPERVLLDQQQFLRLRKGQPRPPRPAHQSFREGESNGLVYNQDSTIMARVQRGLRSRGCTEVLLGDDELGLRQFHHVLDRYLADEAGRG